MGVMQIKNKMTLALWLLVLLHLFSTTEGLQCYVCSDCIKYGAVWKDCEEFYKIAVLDEKQKQVCFKKADTTRIVKGCDIIKVKKGGKVNRCEEISNGKSSARHACYCDSDKCNFGNTAKIQNGLVIGSIGLLGVASIYL